MILKGESAEEFNRKADENYERFKARQKQILIDMMEADEELGLYEKPTKLYTIEDIERCVENWGLCKVEREYIEKFLATKQVVKDSLTTQTVEERALELYPDTQSSDYLWTMRLQQRQAYIKGATDQNKEDETIPS